MTLAGATKEGCMAESAGVGEASVGLYAFREYFLSSDSVPRPVQHAGDLVAPLGRGPRCHRVAIARRHGGSDGIPPTP